jgi:hypothetical protein
VLIVQSCIPHLMLSCNPGARGDPEQHGDG